MIELRGLTSREDWLMKLAEWRSHPDIRPVLLTPYVTNSDIGRQREWSDRVIRSEAEHFFFIVKDEELVGYCGLIKMHMIARSAEMSIMIGPEHMGKGYGTEAVEKLLKTGFHEFNLNRIYVDCYTNSDRWMFFEKRGFKGEGILRSTKFWNGKYYDSIIGGMLRNDFDNNSSTHGKHKASGEINDESGREAGDSACDRQG